MGTAAPLIDAASSLQRKRTMAAICSGATQRLGSASGILSRLPGVSTVLSNKVFAVTPDSLVSAAIDWVSANRAALLAAYVPLRAAPPTPDRAPNVIIRPQLRA